MDYLSPFFNETAYCLGVEKLLGITDEIPERASVIRVMLMELNRISSHLVALATGGMEIGALTVMTFGFRERELVLDLFELITGLRMNHAYIRPGGVAQDLPARRGRQDPRALVDAAAEAVSRTSPNLLQREPDLVKGRTVGRRLPRPDRLHGAGHHRPGAALHRPAARPAQDRSRTAATRPTTSTSPTWDTCDAYGRFRIRLDEMQRVAEDRRAVRSTGCRPSPARSWSPTRRSPGRPSWRSAPTAWATRLDHIREIMGTSMEALIHHFKLVTEGFRVPAGPGLRRRSSRPRGELGAHVVSDGGTRPYRVHFRDPSFTNLQAVGGDVRGRQVADVIVAVASIDPVMGGVDR